MTENIRKDLVIVLRGRHAGKEFYIQDLVENIPGYDGDNLLPELAEKGNMAAWNALIIDKYEDEDAPFYYGKIKEGQYMMGYIIAHKDLFNDPR